MDESNNVNSSAHEVSLGNPIFWIPWVIATSNFLFLLAFLLTKALSLMCPSVTHHSESLGASTSLTCSIGLFNDLNSLIENIMFVAAWGGILYWLILYIFGMILIAVGSSWLGNLEGRPEVKKKFLMLVVLFSLPVICYILFIIYGGAIFYLRKIF